MNDLRFAFRQLQKNPGFTAIAVLTLALGIAGSVVIFSVFNGLFLRPLPFKEPGQLVNLDEVAPKWNLEYTGVNYDDFFEWRAGNQTFETMGVRQNASFNFSVKGTAERIEGCRASHDFLGTMRDTHLPRRGQPDGSADVRRRSPVAWSRDVTGLFASRAPRDSSRSDGGAET